MKRSLLFALVLLASVISGLAESQPLRVFIRAGEKTHGPGQHDHPRFLKEWTALLNERGAKADGAMGFPTAEQLDATDVLVMYAADAGTISTGQRAVLDKFLKRGGGLVVIHDAVCGKDAPWFKTVVGGAWDYSHAKFFEGDISFYYQDYNSPITKGVSNFNFDDEMYYDLDMMPEAHVLAAVYRPDDRNKHDGHNLPSVYDIVPQMWTYEKDNYRAFVAIPGHNYKSFNLPHFRAVLLRGIAWAGKRDAGLLVSKDELASLRYPEGGPTAPEKAAEKIVVPPDFNINLVAAEPLIDKPISMDWDAKGRLWIAETPEYPYRQDRSIPAYDRISILEDSKGQGRMDKKTVFYEGLDLVTSMVLYKDGVIVSQAPDIYWLRDTKGTGKADTKVVLYKGFGTKDTHAVLSNLRWGMDGWVYATVGYSRGDIYSGDDKKHFGAVVEGVFRFKPDGSALEQVSSKGGNTWGVDIAPDGEIFFTQANGSHIDHVVMPESALARGRVGNTASYQNIEDHRQSFPLLTWKQQAYVQIDWVGNFTAAAGCCIYDGGAWPEKYNYTHYVAEPTLNIVHQDVLTPKGVSYVASKAPETVDKEFVASTDLWFRPIHMRVGPDGALYVLDFYNQAVVHNDTRGTPHDPKSNAAIRPDRDHYFGRIWRVQHKDAKPVKVPNLAKASPAELVKSLDHPNEWVRMTAQRLLRETATGSQMKAIEKFAADSSKSPEGRILALWLMSSLGGLNQPVIAASLEDKSPVVRKNILQMISATGATPDSQGRILPLLTDANARVKLEALIALGSSPTVDEGTSKALISSYPDLKDPWLESAAVGVASKEPLRFITAAMDSSAPDALKNLVGQLSNQIGGRQDSQAAAELIVMMASKPASADSLKQVALENLVKELKPEVVPAWSPELANAFHGLLASPDTTLATLSLPLMARWDKGGAMAGDLKSLVLNLSAKLADAGQPDEARAQIVTSLLGVRQMSPQILPSVEKILGSAASVALQRRVIESLGSLKDAGVGNILVQSEPSLSPELQEAALNQLFKRADWSMTLLDAIQVRQVNLASLGPVSINRLRTHSDKAVAERANQVIDELRGPEAKEKNALIAKFTPLVTQPGDAAHGRQLFVQNCAICHRYNGEGKDIAPDLTGMGAHGAAELIIHVLDPNREVEPNYYAYSVETKDGETYDGIITRENKNSLTLRNAAGDMEIKLENVKGRRNTGLSLMPNGFEALGGDNLRDILAYLCAGEANFRIIDLKASFTANTRKGLFTSQDRTEESLDFKRFGMIKAGDVPFEIINPLKSTSGNNVIVLKGGYGYAKTLPQRVQIENVNLKAGRLDFLGGVGGWAYPWNKDFENAPVAKVTVHYADDQTEEIILKNGQEIADYVGSFDVPKSKAVADLVTHGQVRWFGKSLKHPGTIRSLTLESFDNAVAPVFVAITAEVGAGAATADADTATAPGPLKWGQGTHVLSVGGGSSHDFNRWFNQADSATLGENGKLSVNYTENLDSVLPALKETDVLYLTSNQPIPDPQLRKGIFEFANAGHGLLMVHPALWYNWKDWPEYNRELVGGGATSHDKYGEFEVTIKDEKNPLVAGVPKSFRITDELYHAVIDQKGTPVEVLAEGRNLATGATYPVLWIVKHPKARIVCCTLGHDAKAHELEAYKTILRNSANWTAGK
jgi:putative membrane-bound dehydrogenase-like protein